MNIASTALAKIYQCIEYFINLTFNNIEENKKRDAMDAQENAELPDAIEHDLSDEEQDEEEEEDDAEQMPDNDDEFEMLQLGDMVMEWADSSDDSDDSDDSIRVRRNFLTSAAPSDTLHNHTLLRRCLSSAFSGRQKQQPIYKFQPLQLSRVHYKKYMPYPVARSGHRVIASESHLYSLGGYNPSSAAANSRNGYSVLFQELWSFNFASKHWKLVMNAKSVDNMPTELASNALVICNDRLISHGGTGFPFGESCSNSCIVYDVGSDPSVRRLNATGELPTAQYGPGIVIHKNYLYTIGGTTGFEYSCDVFRLSLKTCMWENVYMCRPEMRDDPEGRYRHEVIYDGKYIYVLGGGTSNTVFDLQRIPGFNLETNNWEHFNTLPDPSIATTTANRIDGYPKPRKCFTCVQNKSANGDIEAFITGGLQVRENEEANYYSDIWRLNMRTKQWSRINLSKFVNPLYFHSAAQAGNGCMYIFGGIEYNPKETHRSNHLYKFWMTIPKLSEMCWDAITFYNDNVQHYSKSYLLASGIPKRYVERLPEYPRHRKNVHESACVGSLLTPPKRLRTFSLS